MADTVTLGGGGVDGYFGKNPDWSKIKVKTGRTIWSSYDDNTLQAWLVEDTNAGGVLLAGGNYANPIQIAGNGLPRIAGYFVDGFVFENPNQVGIDASGNSWQYVGTSPLPYTVTAGTDPNASSDYEKVFESTLQNLNGLEQPSDLDKVIVRTRTLAQAVAEDAPVGTRYYIDDVFYKVVDISESGGFYTSLNATKKLEINLNQPSIPASLISSITIGSGGNFGTITEALDVCRKIKVDSQNKHVNALLLSGFELNEQVVISGIDLSYCVITSEDATVNVNANVWTLPIQEGGYTPAIAVRFGAVSPLFNVVFDAGEDASADENKAGFLARGFGKILSSGGLDSGEHLGFINLNGRGLYCFQNGEAQANYSELNNNYVGHRCSNNSRSQIRWSNLNNCTSFSIMCDSSYINASQATGDDSGVFAISTNCGDLMLINAFGRRTTLNSVQIIDGGGIVLTDTDLSDGAPALIATGGTLSGNRLIHSGTTGDAIDARSGAKVDIPQANLSGSGNGIRARFGAHVTAYAADVSNCGFGVISDGSLVECNAIDASNCATGLYTINEGEIKAGESSNASGATSTGLNATSGKISATGINITNCARALQASNGGEIKVINADESGRTSQSRVLTGGVIHATGMTGNSGAILISDFANVTAFNEYGSGGVVYKTI